MMDEVELNLPDTYISVEIFFGAVHIGKSSTRCFPIKNTHKEVVQYVTTRNKDTNPIYYVFDIDKYEASVEPGAEFIIKITYSPNIPGVRNVDYFKVMDNRMNLFKICVIGECIGPEISCSVRNLEFSLMPGNMHQRKRVIELSNDSNVPAIFQFDCNEDNSEVFQVDKIRGTIEPMKYIYVTIVFAPPKTGLFSRQLACLVLFHEPILINLYGFHSNEKSVQWPNCILRPYPFPHNETVSYCGYLSDSSTIKTNSTLPPISLSANFLDFRRIVDENLCCNTLTTSLTNHLQNEVNVEWLNSKIFQVHPEKLIIPGDKSALYECRFVPDTTSSLYSTILHGQVTWMKQSDNPDNQISVPIPISIRLIGHSFPKNQSWIPEISLIPECVILPLTLPGYFSYATFMIKSSGHLPVLFKLLPPKKSNFIMKPMVGLIRDFQIIVVQLQPNISEKTSYIEKWHIELNGQPERIMSIFIKGHTDIPSIKIGAEFNIEFEAMQPGTRNCICVPLKNTSSCALFFKFDLNKIDENIMIDPLEGELSPNEEILTSWCYTADSSEGIQKYTALCRIEGIFSNNIRMGLPIEIPITVTATTSYSELCALPKFYDAGEVESGAIIKRSFYLFNFGDSTVYFQLITNHNMKDVTLLPEFGECGPKQKIKVDVVLTVTEMGAENMLIVSYYNRTSHDTKSWTDFGHLPVFQIKYHCSLFAIKIDDIVDHNYGNLFSKKHLWKLLRIDEINRALNETVENEIRRIDLHVPECIIGPNLFYIIFIVKNVTKIEARLILKRRITCNCEPKKSSSITNRYIIHDCPHTQSFTMDWHQQNILPPKSSSELKLFIKYLVPDENIFSYEMLVGKNKTIELNVSITGITRESPILSVYNPNLVFDLGRVYIGRREAPIKAYWLYNNTYDPIPFKLDDLEIIKMCNKERFEVLKCLNCEGLIAPKSRKAILFKFLPIEVKSYNIDVPLMLGKKLTTLSITGGGILANFKFKSHTEKFRETDHNLIYNILSLSTDHIIAEPILVGSLTEHMIFIKNRSSKSEIKYSWKPCCIDGLVKIDIEDPEGVLIPHESRPVIIKISSLNEPCEIEILLFCEFIDQTQLNIYEKEITEFQEQQSKKLQEFTITDDKSISNSPEPDDVPFNIQKRPEFLTVALPIDIRIVGVMDKDICLSVEHQFKQRPFRNLQINVDEFANEIFKRVESTERPLTVYDRIPPNRKKSEKIVKCDETIDVDMTKNVLESLIADTVFSDYFQETIDHLRKEPIPFYPQIKINDSRDRKEEMVKYLTQLQPQDIVDIYKDALLENLKYLQ